MALLVELLVYLVVEVVGDLLLEGGARGAVRVLRTRTGRYVTLRWSGSGSASCGARRRWHSCLATCTRTTVALVG